MSQAPSPEESTSTVEVQWSPRQREVLDLLAARKTNGEIAEALGVSLDGAKYHVREILDRLDVDTREEAAEWWRQQRGMKARMQVVMRRWRMPALLKLGGVGAAAAVAVAAVGIFLASPGGDDGEAGGPLHPGMWVAVAIPEGDPDDLGPGDEPTFSIEVYRMDADDVHTVATGGDWRAVTLSPGGGHVAAISMGAAAGEVAVEVFDLVGGGSWKLPPVDPMNLGLPAWSPDGRVLVLSGGGTIRVMSASGSELGLHETAIEEQPAGDLGLAGVLGETAWSPDGAYAAVALLDRLAIVDASGAFVAASTLEEIAVARNYQVEDALQQAFILPWDEEGRIVLHGNVGVEGEVPSAWTFRGELRDGEVDWSAEEGGDYPAYFGGVAPDWMREYDPFDAYIPLTSHGTQYGIIGSSILWHEDADAGIHGGIHPGQVPEGARVSILVQSNDELYSAELDVNPEWVLTALRGPGMWWDAVMVREQGP